MVYSWTTGIDTQSFGEALVNSFRTGFFSEFKPGFPKALILTKRCAKISGIEKSGLGRIRAPTREIRQKQARTEDRSQKGGYYNGLSESESGLTGRDSRIKLF